MPTTNINSGTTTNSCVSAGTSASLSDYLATAMRNPCREFPERYLDFARYSEPINRSPVITTQSRPASTSPSPETIVNPLDIQVGGSHYKSFKIQPFEFFIANQVPFHKADIIKRIMRYDMPTGKGLEDLKKIKHEIDLIIQIEGLE